MGHPARRASRAAHHSHGRGVGARRFPALGLLEVASLLQQNPKDSQWMMVGISAYEHRLPTSGVPVWRTPGGQQPMGARAFGSEATVTTEPGSTGRREHRTSGLLGTGQGGDIVCVGPCAYGITTAVRRARDRRGQDTRAPARR